MDLAAIRRRIVTIACMGNFGPRVVAAETIFDRGMMRNAVQDAVPGVTFVIQHRNGKAFFWATAGAGMQRILELHVDPALVTPDGLEDVLALVTVLEVVES